MKLQKRLLSAGICLAFVLTIFAMPASAKTISAAKASRVFFYGETASGEDILLKVLSLDELEKLSHGQANGEDYYFSSIDNYPTTQYAQGRGFSIQELLDTVVQTTTVSGADSLSFTGQDTLRLMATDSFGSYTRSWTHDALCSQMRYYFEDLYDTDYGWKAGWEIAGEENSKYGLTLEEYNAQYRESDPYYANKRKVLEGGVEMPVILAVQSYSGRTSSDSLTGSTEPGIASYIAQNGGVVTDSLKGAMVEDYALRLCIPMSEADLMTAHRTAYDNFKWIYNLLLETAKPNALISQGSVASPEASFQVSGNTLDITLTCTTPGANIYYSEDGAPQIPYTGTIHYDITGRDLSADPVTIYMTAVREGYSDAGVVYAKYPSSGIRFQNQYTAMVGEELTFSAAVDVTDEEWNAWTNASLGVSMKGPSGTSYQALSTEKYTFLNAKKAIIFDKSLFSASGSYSFLFYAKGYANQNLSVTMKKPVPTVSTAVSSPYGQPVTLTFNDSDYHVGLTVYVIQEGGSRSMISNSYLDRTSAGQVMIKKEYFTLQSTAMPAAGNYTLELTNNSYAPAAQTVTLKLTDDSGGFSDIPAGAWYAQAVGYVVDAGLFTGTSSTSFSPDGNMTRAMLVTVLYRLEGEPGISGINSFQDVSDNSWYSKAVCWASEQQIIGGYGNGLFGTDDPVTREQLATILHRYAGQKGYDTTAQASLSAFSDTFQISAYAMQAIQWAVAAGIVTGINETNLSPKGTATRAQVATMLMRFTEGVVNS